jgi:hypothetical protein
MTLCRHVLKPQPGTTLPTLPPGCSSFPLTAPDQEQLAAHIAFARGRNHIGSDPASGRAIHHSRWPEASLLSQTMKGTSHVKIIRTGPPF